MASELNLDCMEAILKFLTPKDWILVSEVCTWWKTATNEMWRKIDAISLTRFPSVSSNYFGRITSEEAQKMVRQAAPFIKFLSTDLDVKKFQHFYSTYITILESPSRSFCYEVILPNITSLPLLLDCLEKIFKTMADNASELTEVKFDGQYVPPAETLKVLFNDNSITTVSVENVGLQAICANNLTDKIQELKCNLIDRGDVNYNILFQGHFPNLQNLNISVFDREKLCEEGTPMYRPILQQSLPYVPGLKSLTVGLPISWLYYANSATDKIEKILKMSKLEELSISFSGCPVYDVDFFLQKLAELLLELRIVQFRRISLSNIAISSLMTLPKLESLFVEPKSDISLTNVPQMVHLSKLFIWLPRMNGVVPMESFGTAISNMIRQMPKLKFLAIENYIGDEVLKIVCRATAIAMSQQKNVLITTLYAGGFGPKIDPYKRIIKIERKQNKRHLGCETLNIRLKATSCERKRVEGYLTKNLKVDTLTFITFKKESLTLLELREELWLVDNEIGPKTKIIL